MAKATKKVEVTVTLLLSGEEARALASILHDDVDWAEDTFGGVAESIYDALEDLELG